MSLVSFVVALGLVLVLPLVVVGYAQDDLERSAFVWRMAGLLVLSIAGLVIAEYGSPGVYMPLAVLNVFGYRWIAMRLNDVGWSRWLAMLWIFGPAGLVLTIVLCFKRSAGHEADLAEVFD